MEGGTHEEGFRLALTRVINNYAKSKGFLKKDEEALSGDDVREGLTAIISVKHPDPQYEGQTKTKLGNAEVRKIASNIISSSLDKFLLENPDTAKIIIDKAIVASRARMAAKKAREMTRRKMFLKFLIYQENLQIVQVRMLVSVKFLLSKGIRLVVVLKWGVIVEFRPFYHYVVKF